MLHLRHFFSYLSRMPRTYGFGVQSPFAYRFVRQTVNGHNDFLLSPEVELLFSTLPRKRRRVYLLFLRFASFMKGKACFLSPEFHDACLTQAMHAVGCEACGDLSSFPVVSFSIITPAFRDWDGLFDRMDTNGMVVIWGIRDKRDDYRYWRQLVEDKRTFVSFDLYDVGVLFFDPKMFKRTYCCNY